MSAVRDHQYPAPGRPLEGAQDGGSRAEQEVLPDRAGASDPCHLTQKETTEEAEIPLRDPEGR